jgi:hypothetical protein
MNTLLNTSKKIIPVVNSSIFNSIWFWIALIEFLLIIFLVYKLKTKKNIPKLSDMEARSIKGSRKNDINMDNLMNNIHNSRLLYKELSRKCHPERFVNDPKQKIAEEIFQEISKNERNHKELSLLKLRAINELNLTFK